MNKVIYFSRTADVLAHAQLLAVQGYACLMDEPFDSRLAPLPALDSDDTEQALAFLFGRLQGCGAFEASVIHAQLFAQYPRLFRSVQAARAANGRPVAYFFPKERLSIYDLALSFDGPCDFQVLDGDVLEPARLESLVEFYAPAGPVPAPATASAAPAGWGARLSRWFGRRGGEAAAVARPALPRKVLFLAHDNEGNLYLRPLVAVFAELARRGIPFEVVSCDARAARFLDAESLPHRGLASLMAGQGEDGPEAAAAMARWFEQANAGETVQSGEPLYDALFRNAMNSAVRRDVWQSRQSSARLEAHIQAEGVSDVFFVPDGTPIAAGLHHGLKRLGVTTHTVVAAGVSRFKRAVAHYMAQNIYVAGKDARSAMLYHFPARNVVAVGNPVLDRYLAKGPADLAAGSRRIVLVGTSGFDAEEGRWIAELATRLDAGRFLLVLKPHPSYVDRYASLGPVLAQHGHILSRATDVIEPLVNAAHIVVTDHSQVGIDAHLLGKPVVSMYAGPGDILYMKHISSIRYVRTVDALLEALEAPLGAGVPAPDFVDAFNAHGDSHYYRRIVDNIVRAHSD